MFNIQRYSVHDGPGIRTLVFLKGCPLRCQWCANPESQSPAPQVAYNKDKCIGAECLLCQRVCPERAIFYPGTAQVQWQHERCIDCGRCAQVCPAKAFSIYGDLWEHEDVIDQVEKEQAFYSHSEGGMTLSGGEPFFQPAFAAALLREAKRRMIHTAAETSGCVPWLALDEALPYLDYVLYDIKMADGEVHRRFTGQDNSLILDNLRRLKEKYPDKPVKVRTPVIPGVNDRPEKIAQIKSIICRYPNTTYELLKYHRFGQQKYDYLGKAYLMTEEAVDERLFEELKIIAES